MDAARGETTTLRSWIDSGLADDFVDLVTRRLGSSARDRTRQVAGEFFDLVSTPAWRSVLESSEQVAAVRWSVPVPELTWVARVSEASALARLGELKLWLEELATATSDRFEVTDATLEGVRVVRWERSQQPDPWRIVAAVSGELLVVSTADRFVDHVFALAKSAGPDGSVLRSARWQKVRGEVDSAASEEAALDLRAGGTLLSRLCALGLLALEKDDSKAVALRVAADVLGQIARLGTLHWVRTESVDAVRTVGRCTFDASSEPGVVERWLSEVDSAATLLEGLPDGCVSFSATSGVRLASIHDELERLFRAYYPKGSELLGRWSAMQRRAGIDLRRDFLAGFAGPVACARVGEGRAMWLELSRRDAESVPGDEPRTPKQWVHRLVELTRSYLDGRGLETDFVEVSGLANHWELRVEALPWWRPVLGVRGHRLVVASSVSVARVIDTAGGAAKPTVAKRLELALGGEDVASMRSVSYHRGPRGSKLVADVMGFAGFSARALPSFRSTRTWIRVGGLLTKLASWMRSRAAGRVERHSFTRFDRSKRRYEWDCRVVRLPPVRTPDTPVGDR